MCSNQSWEISLVTEFHGNWKILEYGIYDKQDSFCPIYANFALKYQNCPLKIKLGIHTTSVLNNKKKFLSEPRFS